MSKNYYKIDLIERGIYAEICSHDRIKALIPVCSGNMLFNLFDEYLGFLGA